MPDVADAECDTTRHGLSMLLLILVGFNSVNGCRTDMKQESLRAEHEAIKAQLQERDVLRK